MDAGVSLAFKKRWPRMAEEFKVLCAEKRFALGDVFVWSEGDEIVYNLGVQEHWKKKATLAALSRAVAKALTFATKSGVTNIAFTRIGAGLGGLDWPRVKSVMTEVGNTTPINLLVFEKFVRTRRAGRGRSARERGQCALAS